MFRRAGRRPDDWPSSHVRARAALSDRLDEALEPAEARWLDDHLAACAECRATADAYQQQRLELRALRDRAPLPPRDLWARTAAAIELEARGRSARTRRLSIRPVAVPSALVATALAVVVAAGLLTSSQLTPPRGDGGGSTPPGLAAASGGASGPASPTATRIPITAKIDFAQRDAAGDFRIRTANIDELCPAGSADPCNTSGPTEDHAVTIDQDAQAVFGDANKERLIVVSSPTIDDPGTVSVVSLASAAPTPTPTPTPSTEASPTPTSSDSGASPTPTAPASPASPPPSTPASPSPSPTPLVTASPTGSIDVTPSGNPTQTVEIAHGVVLVGQTAAYSRSGAWFAFTARPIDGTAGPDIYLWQVGSASARKVTDDGRSVFGSWVDDELVGSTAVDPGKGGDIPATNGIKAASFFLDPATSVRTELPQTGSAWRPVVDPSGRKAVYWTGTLRAVPGPGFAPEGGKLVLGEWNLTGPAPSGEPGATPLAGDQAAQRHETTIGAGQIDDWDARWDPSGTHLAVWIADHENPAIGRLSLYAVSAFDGSIDLKAPLLQSRRSMAGFSITDGGLIWAQPSDDPAATANTIQFLGWNDEGIGTVETVTGPALVIR